MFCDLVGSTALSASLDPEDLSDLIRKYQQYVSEAVARYDGFIAKYMGDGILVYFGYPSAKETDAERAILTAIEIVKSSSTIASPTGEPIEVRIGISTGLVVVGEIIGQGESQERNIVGETPNRAARLQAVAEPDWIVVDASTRRLVGELFGFVDLGEATLKGFSNPVHIWRIIGTTESRNRFQALRSERVLPLVGREEELNFLLSLSERVGRGEGHTALIRGEPGIGKSRLVAGLDARSTRRTLSYFCSPLHAGTAFYPFISQVETAAGVRVGQSLDEKVPLIRAALRQIPDMLDDDIATLTELVTGASQSNVSIPPQEARKRIEHAILSQIAGLATRSPLHVVIEDAHWADTNSRELIGSLIDRIASLPVLIVITFRPEFSHGWGQKPHVLPIELTQLSNASIKSLIANISAGKSLPADLVEQIVQRTDGIPLFVEELTRTLLESEAVQESRREYVLLRPITELGIPETLYASLVARLDRLDSAKEVAQFGATIGRTFSCDLLKTVTRRDEDQLQQDLRRLVQSGLLELHDPSGRMYRFRHALVQEAAYSTLLRTRRQELHGAIANTLEQTFGDVAANQPGLLAHHFTEAKRFDEAIIYWTKAGDLAARRASYPDACQLFETALKFLNQLADSERRARLELELRIKLGAALSVARGPGAEEVERTFAVADGLASALKDRQAAYRALWGLYYNHLGRARMRQARAEAGRLIELSKELGSDIFAIEALHAGWTTAHFSGRPLEARSYIEEGWRRYDPKRHEMQSIAFSGHDAGACSRAIMSMSLWTIGFPEQALRMAEEALSYAEVRAHAFSTAWAGWMSATTFQLSGNASRCRDIAQKVTQESREHGFATAGPVAEMLFVWSRFALGETAACDAATEMLGAIDRGGPNHKMGPWWHSLIASVCMEAGELSAALEILNRGLQLSEQTGLGFLLPELYRLLGDCLLELKSFGREEIADKYRKAIEIAQDRGMKFLELRAANRLVRLLQEPDAALTYLAPIFYGFSEGQNTSDLAEAKALLEELV
jgi:class 3 adenylate cyclase/tetratricopeptide (TPR) repeat protein